MFLNWQWYEPSITASCVLPIQNPAVMGGFEPPVLWQLGSAMSWFTNKTPSPITLAISIPKVTIKLLVKSDKQQSWLHCIWSTYMIQWTPASAHWGEGDSKEGWLAKEEHALTKLAFGKTICNHERCMENGKARTWAATACLLELVQTYRGGELEHPWWACIVCRDDWVTLRLWVVYKATPPGREWHLKMSPSVWLSSHDLGFHSETMYQKELVGSSTMPPRRNMNAWGGYHPWL